MFQKNKQTLGKEKAKNININDTKHSNNNNVFEKGFDGQKAKKNGFLKGKTKRKTDKENKIGRKKDFKDRHFGGTKKKTFKIAGNNFFGPFYKTQAQNTEEKTKPPKKNRSKNTFLHFGKQPLIFGKFLFFQVTLFHVCKSCVLLKIL